VGGLGETAAEFEPLRPLRYLCVFAVKFPNRKDAKKNVPFDPVSGMWDDLYLPKNRYNPVGSPLF